MELDQHTLDQLQAIRSSAPDKYPAMLERLNIADPFADPAVQQTVPVVSAPTAPVVQAQAPATDPAQPAAPVVPAPLSPLEEAAKDNPFLASFVPGAATTSVDIFDHYSTKMGVVLTPEERTPAKLAEVIDGYASLMEQRTEMAKVATNYQMINDNLSALPVSFQNIIASVLQNPSEDNVESLLRGYVEQRSIDFTKPFEKHDQLAMINKFATDTPLETLEGLSDGAVRNLTTVAKSIYQAKQHEMNSQQGTAPTAILTERTAKFNTSVDSSVAELDKLGNLLSSAQKREIATTMYARGNGSLFNPDGTYTPDAAIQMAWAKFGKNWLEQTTLQAKQAVDIAYRKGAADAVNKGLFPYGEQAPRPMGTATPVVNQTREEAKAEARKRLGLNTNN